MSNRVTLDALAGMKPAALAAIPADQLAMLQDDLEELKLDTQAKASVLADAFAAKYSDAASANRKAAGKDTGAITIADGDFAIKADLPKKVEWDQAKLKAAIARIAGWGENPNNYVNVKYDVSETKFNAWPPAIREVFEEARTVKPGNQTFKIEVRKEKR